MAHDATVDRDEIGRFSGIGERWWDPEGPMRPLHKLTPFRIDWIWQQCKILLPNGADVLNRPLAGLTVLDIGCGGGLVSEPMAALGAEVTGLDADAEGIAAATAHAADSGVEVEYRCATASEIMHDGKTFDIVLALEVIEHTADPALFQKEVAALARPGGLVIASTLNRTAASYLGGVLAAEYLLGWVPRGTHDWRKFVKPSEMAAGFRPHGLTIQDMAGVQWEPTTDCFRASKDFSINYIMAFRKAG